MKILGTFLAGLVALVLGAASTAPAQAQDGYRIRPGDVLRIEVLEDANLNRSVLVAPDGRVTLPLAGAVPVSGRTVEAVQAEITTRIASNFAATPNVYVGVEGVVQAPPPTGPAAAATIDVFVMGEAGKPGALQVAPGTNMLQLFAQMGGFSPFAATKRIQLRRVENGAERIYTINYKAIEAGTSNAGMTTLRDGDVIVVPQRKLFE
jgi:polysaccharide export outer membrane protein